LSREYLSHLIDIFIMCTIIEYLLNFWNLRVKTATVRNRPLVMLIDDSPTNLHALGNILSRDYDILIATSGDAAIDLLKETRDLPDIVLLDVMMPGLSGYDVCKMLKENNEWRNIPVIFITILDSEQDETTGFDLGAADYIIKPFSEPVVLARIKTQITLKQRTDQLESLAKVDGLTEISNRRAFDDHLNNLFRKRRRQSFPLSLLLIDIDHFKKYNDKFGHGIGDQCLKLIAKCIQKHAVNPEDMAASWGGEEFVLILPKFGLQEAVRLGTNLLREIEDLNIEHPTSDTADVITVSIGAVSSADDSYITPEDFISMADKALYTAKNSGRNRLSVL